MDLQILVSSLSHRELIEIHAHIQKRIVELKAKALKSAFTLLGLHPLKHGSFIYSTIATIITKGLADGHIIPILNSKCSNSGMDQGVLPCAFDDNAPNTYYQLVEERNVRCPLHAASYLIRYGSKHDICGEILVPHQNCSDYRKLLLKMLIDFNLSQDISVL